jgi:hypothetical protein
VAADELLVFCKRDVAFDYTGTLAAGRAVGFEGVFGVLEGSAAVCEGEVCGLEVLLGTALEFLLEGTFVHIFDQVVWSVTDLDVEFLVGMVESARFDGWDSCGGSKSEKDG